MIKRICNLLSTLVLILLLGVAATIFLPLVFGLQEMAVLSGSMEPGIPVGSIIYVRPSGAEGLEPGDVCTYLLADGQTRVTHRVVQVDAQARTLVTKGDANESEDGAVSFDSVVGKAVFHLPYLGYISMNARTPLGILVLCGVFVVIILLNFIPAILDADEEEKRQA